MTKQTKILLALLGIGVFFMASIRISKAGVNKIIEHEGLRLKPYKDSAGLWTIGYGHLIKFPEEKYLLNPEGIIKKEAEKLLKHDLKPAEKAVNDFVKMPLTGNQYDALVSFVYNVGSGNFADSTMLRRLNVGDYDGAAAEFPKWKYAGGKENAGLLARRAKEQNLFLS